jgi:hypothetical protein
MKICYLLQGRDDFEKTLQLADALGKEDYVVCRSMIMVGGTKLLLPLPKTPM